MPYTCVVAGFGYNTLPLGVLACGPAPVSVAAGEMTFLVGRARGNILVAERNEDG